MKTPSLLPAWLRFLRRKNKIVIRQLIYAGMGCLSCTAAAQSSPTFEAKMRDGAPQELAAKAAYWEEGIKHPDCDARCQAMWGTHAADIYLQIGNPAKSLELYTLAANACQAIPAEEKRTGQSNQPCLTAEMQRSYVAAEVDPASDVAFPVLKQYYEQDPAGPKSAAYMRALQARGLKVEYQREAAFQERILEVISKHQPLIRSKYMSGPLEGAAHTQALANMYGEYANLYNNALAATKKFGLTQHDAYLTKMRDLYLADHRQRAAYANQLAAQQAAAQQGEPNPPQKRDDTLFGMDANTIASIAGALGAGGKQGALGAISAYASGMAAQQDGTTSGPSPSSSFDPFAFAAQITGTPMPPAAQAPAPTIAATPAPSQPISTPVTGGGVTGTSCHTNLAHLAPYLHQFNEPRLQQLRATILQEDLSASFKRALATGKTPAQIVAHAERSAGDTEAKRASSEQCFQQVSTSPQSVIDQLQNGTYQFSKQTILDNCAAHYVAMTWGAIAMKQTAHVYGCMANQR